MSEPDAISRDPTLPAAGDDGEGDDRLEAGAVAGDFVVERHIGAGAMGDVYAGHHPVIGKRVAIKVLKRALARRADAAARFLREARAVNHVDHPGVVDVFALGRLADGRLFLVMDLLDGRSLRERLRAGPVAATVAMRVLRQIAAALDAAHGKGVIHRDLKPDNVVLTGDDRAPTAHVLDFGIARLVADVAGERAPDTLTGEGAWLGTPAYMAPEQWSAEGATPASDRYAIGIIAYELLAGRVPFAASTLTAMMDAHFRAAVPSVTGSGARGRAVFPAAVDRVLARALAKEPGDRYPSATAMVAELEAALAGAPVRPATGRTVWLAAGAAGAVAIAAGVLVLAGRGQVRQGKARPIAGTTLIEVTSTPPGARVLEGTIDRGATPTALPATEGQEIAIDLVMPGYVTAHRLVTARTGEPAAIDAALALVTGFEGVWSMPEGDGLRAFERRGDRVAAFELASAGGARQFLRFFEFVPSTSAVVFVATEPFVDERAPDEPSCNIPLRAEYRYEPGADHLELRRERAQYTLAGGRCQLAATVWSDPRPLARVAGAPEDAVWAESRAGAGPQNGPDPQDVGDDGDGGQAAPSQEKPAPANDTTRKAPPAKKAPPSRIAPAPTKPTAAPAPTKPTAAPAPTKPTAPARPTPPPAVRPEPVQAPSKAAPGELSQQVEPPPPPSKPPAVRK